MTLVLVRDLLFLSKIRAAAETAGIEIQTMREPSQLQQTSGSRLIVDLNQPGALDAAAAWRRATGNPVIGFVSHVDVETMQAARAAGIEQVLPRSRFVAELSELLR